MAVRSQDRGRKGNGRLFNSVVGEIYRCSLMQKKMKEEREERVMKNSADVVEVDERKKNTEVRKGGEL